MLILLSGLLPQPWRARLHSLLAPRGEIRLAVTASGWLICDVAPGETVAPVADGVCDTFSFFDCHAEKVLPPPPPLSSKTAVNPGMGRVRRPQGEVQSRGLTLTSPFYPSFTSHDIYITRTLRIDCTYGQELNREGSNALVAMLCSPTSAAAVRGGRMEGIAILTVQTSLFSTSRRLFS